MEPPTLEILPEGVSLERLMKLYQNDLKKKAAKKAFNESEAGKTYNLAKAKAYYEKHKAEVLAKRKERYEKDGALLNERCKSYYHKKKAEKLPASGEV